MIIQTGRIAVKYGKEGHASSSQDSEISGVIERLAALSGGEELLARIFTVLSQREREILWGYHFQTDAHELGYELGIETQSAQNQLLTIKEKLGFVSRPELLRRVFAALLGRLKKS